MYPIILIFKTVKKVLGALGPLLKIAIVIGLVLAAIHFGLFSHLPVDNPLPIGTATATTTSAGVPSSMSPNALPQQETPNATQNNSSENMSIVEMAEANVTIEDSVEVIKQAQNADLTRDEAQRVSAWIYAQTGQNVDLASDSDSSTSTPSQTDSSSNSGSTDSESDNNSTSVWDKQMFRHSENVVLHDVEYRDGQAIVYMSYTGDGEGPQVQVSDATRTSTGEIPKTVRSLEQGHNRLRVDLTNPSATAVTIDVEGGRFFLHNKEPPTNWLPEVAFGIVVLLMGMFSQIGLTSGIELLLNRKNRKPKREI